MKVKYQKTDNLIICKNNDFEFHLLTLVIEFDSETTVLYESFNVVQFIDTYFSQMNNIHQLKILSIIANCFYMRNVSEQLTIRFM